VLSVYSVVDREFCNLYHRGRGGKQERRIGFAHQTQGDLTTEGTEYTEEEREERLSEPFRTLFDPARKDGHTAPVVVTMDFHVWRGSEGKLVAGDHKPPGSSARVGAGAAPGG